MAYVLNQQFGPLSYQSVWDNWGGRGEKWLQGSGSQWFFILSNGDFYLWDGSPTASGTLLANVGATYYGNPNLIGSAPVNQPRAMLSISGSTLTVTRDLAWVSAMQITVIVSDGMFSASRTFTITVV
jgi:hypothetical protein